MLSRSGTYAQKDGVNKLTPEHTLSLHCLSLLSPFSSVPLAPLIPSLPLLDAPSLQTAIPAEVQSIRTVKEIALDPSEEHLTKHKGGDKAHVVVRSIFHLQRVSVTVSAKAALPTNGQLLPPASVIRGCDARPGDNIEGLSLLEEATGRTRRHAQARRVGVRHQRHRAQQRHHRRMQSHERSAALAVEASANKAAHEAHTATATVAAGTTAKKVAAGDLPMNDAILAIESVVRNGRAPAIEAARRIQSYHKKQNVDLLMERMTRVLSMKDAKSIEVKWRALLGVDGGASPNDDTPHSLLKSVELGAATIADFVETVDKVAHVCEKVINTENDQITAAIDKLTGAKSKEGGKKLRALLEESESDTGLWVAVERAVLVLRKQPPSPDKIKASIEAVAAFTGPESDVATTWTKYLTDLGELLKALATLKAGFGGDALSTEFSADVPSVAGFKLTPYVYVQN